VISNSTLQSYVDFVIRTVRFCFIAVDIVDCD
jgi:hypothetical protein